MGFLLPRKFEMLLPSRCSLQDVRSSDALSFLREALQEMPDSVQREDAELATSRVKIPWRCLNCDSCWIYRFLIITDDLTNTNNTRFRYPFRDQQICQSSIQSTQY